MLIANKAKFYLCKMNSGPGQISQFEPLLFVLGFQQEHCCLTYQETEQIASQHHPNFGHLMVYTCCLLN